MSNGPNPCAIRICQHDLASHLKDGGCLVCGCDCKAHRKQADVEKELRHLVDMHTGSVADKHAYERDLEMLYRKEFVFLEVGGK